MTAVDEHDGGTTDAGADDDLLEALVARPQFTLDPDRKEELLAAALGRLHEHHRRACPPFDRVMAVVAPGWTPGGAVAELPALPVGVFKSHRLVSVPDDQVFRTLTSSGTTGAAVSRIHLDRASAARQTRALAAVLTTVLGRRRLPMLVADTASVVRSSSARGAGVLGLLGFGRDHVYALDDELRLDEAAVRDFLERHGHQPFLVFGFTFVVWQHLVAPAAALGLDLSQGVLVHSGGWKKLADRAVSNARFRQHLGDAVGLRRIHNFYGMVEQIGTVFLEGDDGLLHVPDFADVVVRDPVTWAPAPVGTPGVVQVLSVLPTSYPGHSLLTEDLGVVHALDGAPWRGRALEILGRVPRSEVRGCSDTHELVA